MTIEDRLKMVLGEKDFLIASLQTELEKARAEAKKTAEHEKPVALD